MLHSPNIHQHLQLVENSPQDIVKMEQAFIRESLQNNVSPFA